MKFKLKNVLITGAILVVVGGCVNQFSNDSTEEKTDKVAVSENNDNAQQSETKKEVKEEKPKQLTKKEKVFNKIEKLMKSKKAFDAGSYIKGDIPVGEYAFVQYDGSGQYFGESKTNGDIIANENFDNFGYAYVSGGGNIENAALMVNVKSLKYLGVKGAKELFEILNDEKNFKGSGYYKVGTDIKPGTYIFESVDGADGYVSVESGAVGHSDIINNENFNGRYSTAARTGQYLVVSSADIK